MLYLKWTPEKNAGSADERLRAGAAKGLFLIADSILSDSEASAWLTPLASLEEIAGAVCEDPARLVCAKLVMAEQKPENDQTGWNSKHPRHNVFHKTSGVQQSTSPASLNSL